MKKQNVLKIIGIALGIFIAGMFGALAQNSELASDAIGVRIVPNPNHYSISRWYESQGFFGSPQTLTVDGYEAIRDGRTVYVNAANVGDNNTIYTNVYVISYNQDPSEKTVDILGQLISHWKFNDNLVESDSSSCSISSIKCLSDGDCLSGQYCNTSSENTGTCMFSEIKNCSVDNDCPSNFFCDSLKSQITRDMKRVGKLEEIKEALANFKDVNGYYPKLSSGSYLPNKTVSVWPSWQQNLLSSLAVAPSFVDPVNKLGYCAGYDKDTCWNNETKSFVFAPEDNYLKLPAGSQAMVYSSNSEGADYNLCAVLETKALGYHFSPNDPSDSACVLSTGITTGGDSLNVFPVFIDSYLEGQAGQEFNGFIKVYDENNDPLNWNLSTPNTGIWGSWSAFPVLLDTSNKFQKKVYSPLVSADGTFPITIRVDDGRGGVLTKDLDIKINQSGAFIEAQNAVHILDKNNPFSYSFYVSGDNLNNPPSYSVRKISGGDGLNPSFFVPDGNPVLVGDNKWQINYGGNLSPDNYQIPEDVDLTFEISVADKSSREFTKNFNLKIVSEKPVLNFNCSKSVRAGTKYSCFLGSSSQLNHDISYELVSPISDIKTDFIEEGDSGIYLFGNVYKTSGTSFETRDVKIKATNEYGATNIKEFSLRVNTYCGDGHVDEPNGEGKGGLYNDGYEDCDGLAGTTKDPAGSSETKQYACTTFNSNTPLNIASNNYCVFKYPLDGGGYCGDGYCQVKYESISNCASDCSDGTVVIGDGDGCTSNDDCEYAYECNPDGECAKITCPTMTDDDGNVYSANWIDGYCITNKNINVGKMLSSGDKKPNTTNNVIEKWCYNNSNSNCDTYGGLYTWDEAMYRSTAEGARGICPSGWHIPTDAEYNDMKNAIAEHPSLDFGAVFGGYHSNTGSYFYSLNNTLLLWSSSLSFSDSRALRWYINSSHPNSLVYDTYSRTGGLSVRCVQD